MQDAERPNVERGAVAPLQILERVFKIQPDDMRGGHVNNAKFFGWISATFADWYVAMHATGESSFAPQMAHLSYDFLQEMRYPGDVLCRISVTRVGNASLEHSIEIRDANDPQRLCGRGKCINVWMDIKAGKSVPWPADELRKCWKAPAMS